LRLFFCELDHLFGAIGKFVKHVAVLFFLSLLV
jgi:hypothetical protein